MNNRFLRHLQLTLVVLDLLAINTVFFTAESLFRKQLLIPYMMEYTYFGFFLNVCWLAVTYGANMYHEKYITSFEAFTKRSVQGFVYFMVIVSLYLFFSHLFVISRVFIGVILISISIVLLVNRFLYLAIYQYFKKKDYLVNKVVVIGYNNLSKKLVGYLEEEGINKKVVGYCEEEENVSELSNYPILSNVNEVLNVCKEYGATEIYSTITPEQHPGIYKLITLADQSCIRFRIIPDIGVFVKRQVHIEYLNELPIISLRNEPLEDLSNRIKKRAFDIVVSSLVIVFVLSWLVPIISLLIWLESKGPIFFTQLRTGKDNQSFSCLKFRSMRVNEKANVLQATKNDARITRIGRILRRTSLDEFPQFLNVFIGNMSIVGPRPHMLKHTDQYSQLINQYMVRQFLKPGITGWAQVNGYRGETKTVEEMQGRVERDIWYMENWNILLDLKILFLTVYNMVKGEKNAF